MSRLALKFAAAIAVASSWLVCGQVAAKDDAPPSAQTFFRHADFGEVKLSPSGRWLAISTGAKTSRVILAVLDVDSMAPAKVVAAFSNSDVRTFDWVNDDRLVFQLIDLQSGLGDQKMGPGLFSVKRDGSEMRQLVMSQFGDREMSRAGTPPLPAGHVLLAVPSAPGNEDVIVGQYHGNGRGDESDELTPKRLNVVTGKSFSLALDAPSGAKEWLFDPKGEPRVAVTESKGQSEVFWRAPGQDKWKSISKFKTIDATLVPESVDGDGQLFVTTPGPGGTSVVKRFDFATNAPESAPLVSAPGFDFDGRLLMTSSTEHAVGVRLETDAETTVWFDDNFKKIQDIVDAKFPGRIGRIASCRRCGQDDAVALVFAYADRDPGSYWIYRAAKKEWQFIGLVRKDVDPAQMGRVAFERIKARDGEDLPIWITTPAVKSAGPAPAVLLVHGGPWVRGGTWGWNRETQFLASRGYVVIEPEFRGGTGFGTKHLKLGFKHWGDTMQDDLADAVDWAVAKGKIDGNRVCIAGASYGGYATLMSLERYPDKYKCGIAWVAVSDPRLLFENSWESDMNSEAREYSLPDMVGDPTTDAAMLKTFAPDEHAEKIKVPLFLAFGREDHRVPLEHGRRMRDAMHAAGHDPEFVVYDGEGHGWLKVENNIDFYTRMEAFLKKNNP